MTDFMRFAAERSGRSVESYNHLYDWSIDDPAAFWAAVWEYAGVIHSQPYSQIMTGNSMLETQWFPAARLNFAENLLRYKDNHVALISQSEVTPPTRLTYEDLYLQVAACATGFKELGVKQGDRVAALIPDTPEAIIGMLATTSLGAIWSSCSPDFGVKGILDRFGQIQPKVLLTTDGYAYNGKQYSLTETVNRIAERIPEIEQVVIISRPGKYETGATPKSLNWHELVSNDSNDVEFVQVLFDHPVYIMYSSGTTGVPKCMVHGAGGTLLQHFKEHVLHTDLKRQDVITYYTTCGWMMWNWLVSALQVGATIYIYDGSPSHPSLDIFWRAIQDERITVFGTSPKYLSTCQNAGLKPMRKFDLSPLRAILSTGSPLSVGNFEWVYDKVKADVQLSSISGGTDIISCFMLGNPILPVVPGEIQCRGLGMKVEAYDESGKPLQDEVGELVCTAPFPSQPVYFWNDPDNTKYRSAYFEHYPGVWRHGDFIKITEHGGVIVYGRSDATLNPGGVRIGTAEIYAPVEAMSEIEDSLVIGQQWENDVRIVLFVKLAARHELTDALVDRIKQTIRSQQTPRHVPAKIIAVDDIPHTINGKKVELAVTRMVHGQEVTNKDALANPEALEQFESIPELQET